MPSEAEDLIRAHQARYDALRLGTADAVEVLWAELGGPDDLRRRQFAEAAADLVDDAARDMAAATEAYVAEYVETASIRPARSADPLDLVEFTVEQLRGRSPLDVYGRSAIQVRRDLAAGVDYTEAMRRAGSASAGRAQADLALAQRSAFSKSAGRRGLTAYRRVLTGTSCSLCRIASTQAYRTADLMPIHERCDCTQAPIVDGWDGGRIVNRELYRELKASGELDKLNARNKGTTGASRRAAADRRRAARRAPSTEPPAPATAADVGSTTQRPAVREHGELGPVLVDERHAFTAAKRSADEVTDAGDLADRAPVRPPTSSADAVPSAPPAVEAPPVPARFDPSSPTVRRAAERRNISPEAMAAELEQKRARRIIDQRSERAKAKALTVESPEVVEVARRNGVTPDEVMAARGRVPEVRRVIADEAARVQAEAFAQLDQADAQFKVRRPPRSAKVRKQTGAYDWVEELHPRERARLSREWYSDNPVEAPDQLADIARARGVIPFDANESDWAQWWLTQNRRYEAAGAVRRGKMPSDLAYSGRVDVDELIQVEQYRTSSIVGVDDLDAAGYIARVDAETYADDAYQILGTSTNSVHGSPPWRLGFQSWEAEVRDLEYGLRNYPDELPATAWERYEELVPPWLDEPGASFEDLYARIVSTARTAQLDVSPSAVIPWADDIAPPVLLPDEVLP